MPTLYHLVTYKYLWTQAGHGWDVKSVDWHPTKSLLASGAVIFL